MMRPTNVWSTARTEPERYRLKNIILRVLLAIIVTLAILFVLGWLHNS